MRMPIPLGRRPLDLAARYGGEEFALILHDVTLEHARDLAEHLRSQVAALAIAHGAASAAPTSWPTWAP